MIAFAFSRDVPIWVGWNARRESLNISNNIWPSSAQSTQSIFYLPQTNQSPTSIAVLDETLKRAFGFANQSERDSIAVTYDLATAKLAMQLQNDESPKYDKIFVAMGSFHMELAMFGAIGKYIAESGAEHLLHETHVIEIGSLNGYFHGENYNRWKQSHQLLALALDIKYFQAFLTSKENPDVYNDQIEKICKEQNPSENPDDAQELLHDYKSFIEKTKAKGHGQKAKFWIEYVEMMKFSHLFTRSVRVGDLDLFIYCLPKLTNYFFALNRINYARWLVRYHNNLLKLSNTHPDVIQDFKNSLFAIKRTNKSFSRSPFDLTLEQTINADAACQRRGIIALTDSISARQRWAQSHSLRTSIISLLFEFVGISKKENISDDLKRSKIKKNSEDV